ncbi:helix-turn-helix domain-containing protein [Adhaeribacter radiodurans]|uniref:AraC family transcriptional regulator n=1 Tax=Adhaeribacter radiodurans TaxID=2745197 RepID=A0A7L7L133_9BACT|nr:helix-turn-helix domain-containing protein [Adhaeribacter radiodurans]QMU26502.1 AraC family transcriptional regulator [Adhaeribacter radiodurans]
MKNVFLELVYPPLMPYADLLANLMFLSTFIGLLVIIILTLVNKVKSHANYLLSLSLISVTLFTFTSALLINHAIFQVPHLFRINMPLHYLVAPCAYLYVRAVLYQESKFQRLDWLHFVPFLLHTGELLPFMLHSAAYKLTYLQQLLVDVDGVTKQKEGLLPDYYHPVLKFMIGNVYVVLQWQLIRRFSIQNASNYFPNHKQFLNWLWVFTLLNTFLYPPVLIAMFLPISITLLTTFIVVSLGSYLLITSTMLFFRPYILYGLVDSEPTFQLSKHPEEALSSMIKESSERVYSLSVEKRQEYRQKVEAYMAQNQPFLKKGYSIKDLVQEVNVPQHHLSSLINQEYGINFNDFINCYRVEYVKSKLKQPEWRNLTLEGIALEAGFTNRTTFFRAFTKLTGLSPSKFITKDSPDLQGGDKA